MSALGEAAYMTGLERNADLVYMASYAPLFANIDAFQWNPNLIWFNNLKVYGTPNYYVQKLFSTNKGTNVLDILLEAKPVAGQDSLYASAAWDNKTSEIILKIVNTSCKEKTRNVLLQTSKKLDKTARLTILQSDRLDSYNSFQDMKNIVPVEKEIILKAKELVLSLDPYSITVIRIRKL